MDSSASSGIRAASSKSPDRLMTKTQKTIPTKITSNNTVQKECSNAPFTIYLRVLIVVPRDCRYAMIASISVLPSSAAGAASISSSV